MGIVYGAMLANLLPVDVGRGSVCRLGLPGPLPADAPRPLAIRAALMAAGVAASGVRDLLAARGVKAARWPHRAT